MDIINVQATYREWTKFCSRESRTNFMEYLLSNLSVPAVIDAQNIGSKFKKKRKFSIEPTVKTMENEDAWWEMDPSEMLMTWAGIARDRDLLGFIKTLLSNFREDELQEFKSSLTQRARTKVLHPERFVSGPTSVPNQSGWWDEYTSEQNVLAVDCEMIAKIVGYKASGKPRCKNMAGTVAVVDWSGNTICKKTIRHDADTIHLTPTMRSITGFTKNSFANGERLEDVQEYLDKLFRDKLLILVNAGSDFSALQMDRGLYTVFDLHEYWVNELGPIGLRSLVKYYYGIDIQKQVHEPGTDALYTMRLFQEKYISEKLAMPEEVGIKGSSVIFNHIPRI